MRKKLGLPQVVIHPCERGTVPSEYQVMSVAPVSIASTSSGAGPSGHIGGGAVR